MNFVHTVEVLQILNHFHFLFAFHSDMQRFQRDYCTSVTAEDLLVHYGSDRQAVEAVGERFPQLDVESAFTCKSNKTVSLEAESLIIQVVP